MSEIRISGLTKFYGAVKAIDSLDLVIAEGEMVTLLGPSGCGKTTTLRCVAGLESASEGEIHIGGEVMSRGAWMMPPERRGIGMIFQSYALWPHMTVFANVAYTLRLRRISKKEVQDRVMAVLDKVGLTGMAERFPSQLSGGQQQRVALARSIVAEPKILLFDEPLSNLDAKLRERMRVELRRLQKSVGITSLYVTHDQSEALAISDRVVVMHGGKISQIGTPDEVYCSPRDRFIADFIGTMSFMEGTIESLGSPLGKVKLRHGILVQCALPSGATAGQKLVIGVRPEAIELAGDGPQDNQWEMTVIDKSYQGAHVAVDLSIGNENLIAHLPGKYHNRLEPGSARRFRIIPEDIVALVN